MHVMITTCYDIYDSSPIYDTKPLSYTKLLSEGLRDKSWHSLDDKILGHVFHRVTLSVHAHLLETLLRGTVN